MQSLQAAKVSLADDPSSDPVASYWIFSASQAVPCHWLNVSSVAPGFSSIRCT
jgi:hypothetical protein